MKKLWKKIKSIDGIVAFGTFGNMVAMIEILLAVRAMNRGGWHVAYAVLLAALSGWMLTCVNGMLYHHRRCKELEADRIWIENDNKMWGKQIQLNKLNGDRFELTDQKINCVTEMIKSLRELIR